jgi:hypothetical protein
VALTLLRLIDRTDDTVVRQHWGGGGDIVALAESAATIAPLLMPRRVSRVLISKVKPTAEGTGLLVNASRFEPLMVEIAEETTNPGAPIRDSRPMQSRRRKTSNS